MEAQCSARAFSIAFARRRARIILHPARTYLMTKYDKDRMRRGTKKVSG